jgi:hypothetical protein
MSEWKPTSDGPDWSDSGPVELKRADDSIVAGTLVCDEFWTGEDEIPVPHIFLPDGSEVSFWDFARWRTVAADTNGERDG